MKSFVVVVVAALLVPLCGCELLQILSLAQGDGTCPGAEESQGSMTADVDGETFTSCITVGTNDGAFTVTGQEYKDGLAPYQLQISVVSPSVGTHNLGGEEGQGRYTEGVDTTYTTVVDLGTGTVDLATLDDTGAAGTFSFTAVSGNDGESAVEITNGAFDVTFE